MVLPKALAPLGHGGVITPSCATLGGLLLATLWLGEKFIAKRAIGALIIVGGLVVIGGEASTGLPEILYLFWPSL